MDPGFWISSALSSGKAALSVAADVLFALHRPAIALEAALILVLARPCPAPPRGAVDVAFTPAVNDLRRDPTGPGLDVEISSLLVIGIYNARLRPIRILPYGVHAGQLEPRMDRGRDYMSAPRF